jgi:uncharacterized protein YndB with AHSA1/START domain
MEKLKSDTKDRELLVSRTIDAPVDLVWEMWTDPKHITQWWGPDGFTSTIQKMDVRPGGKWNLVLHGPDGTDYINNIIFTEVKKNEKLVFEHVSDPRHFTEVKFEEQGDKTLITWHMIFETVEQFREVVRKHNADAGLKQNMDKLIRYLKR